MKTNRDNSIDMIRFLAITMVVLHHIFLYSIRVTDYDVTPYNKLFADGVAMFCRVNVNLFYLISGFLLTACKTIDWDKLKQRLVKMWGTVFCFSVLIYLGICIFGYTHFDVKDFLKYCFPLMTDRYWFMTVFIGLCLLMPFLRVLYAHLSRRDIILLSVCLLSFDSILQACGMMMANGQGFDIIHGFTMLTIGYCIKCNWDSISRKNWFLMFYIFATVAGVGCTAVGHKYVDQNFSLLYYNSPFIIVAATSLFVFLKNMNIRSTIFTKAGPYVLGIYLFNDHPAFRKVVYSNILHCQDWYTSPYYSLHVLLCLAFFVAGGLLLNYLITSAVVDPLTRVFNSMLKKIKVRI